MGHKEDTEEFLLRINECEGILQKICKLYFDNPADREDVYQDILVNAWKSYPTFRGGSKFSTWLYRVGINTALSELRKRRKIKKNEITQTELTIADEGNPKNENEILMLYKALHQLNEMDKTVALLYLDQLSYRDIATITGLPEVSMGVRISRVKEKIKKILSQYGIR